MESSGEVALVIIFNHRYDRNITILEEIYQKRFKNIFFLVPFYDGDKSNVLPVYESSYYFQGYISQGFKSYYNDRFAHYIFVADDMILNPAVNEDSYQDFFQLSVEASFIPEIFTLNNISNNSTLYLNPIRSFKDKVFGIKNKSYQKFLWPRTVQGVRYDTKKDGVEILKEIPQYHQALEIFLQHGVKIKPLEFVDMYGSFPSLGSIAKIRQGIQYVLKQKIARKQYDLKYPLVASYSDLVIVSGTSIRKFVHYCGVFAASELFVEMAIPTALLLSSKKVVSEPGISKRGKIYWLYNEEQKKIYEEEMSKYDFIVENLLSNFPEDKLYIHPIKLSKWKLK